MMEGPGAVLENVGQWTCGEESLSSQCLPSGIWETCEHLGREMLCAHVEGLLWEVQVKGGLLSTGPRAGLWMVGEFRGEEAEEREAGC